MVTRAVEAKASQIKSSLQLSYRCRCFLLFLLSQDVVTRAVEAKASQIESSLVSYSEEIMGLKGQLAQASHVSEQGGGRERAGCDWAGCRE